MWFYCDFFKKIKRKTLAITSGLRYLILLLMVHSADDHNATLEFSFSFRALLLLFYFSVPKIPVLAPNILFSMQQLIRYLLLVDVAVQCSSAISTIADWIFSNASTLVRHFHVMMKHLFSQLRRNLCFPQPMADCSIRSCLFLVFQDGFVNRYHHRTMNSILVLTKRVFLQALSSLRFLPGTFHDMIYSRQ